MKPIHRDSFRGLTSAAFCFVLPFALCVLALGASPVSAQSPTLVDVTSQCSISTSNERTRYDRRSRLMIKTADVTVVNSSDAPIGTPAHAVFVVSSSQVTMPGMAGGPGVPPYNYYYLDVSSDIGDGTLAPGESITFGAEFRHSRRVRFTYTVKLYAPEQISENTPPVANAGEDQTIQLQTGQETAQVTLDGSGSYDQDGQPITFAWLGTPDPEDVVFPIIALSPGEHTFTLIVTDDQGADSDPDTVTVTVNEAPNIPPSADAGDDQIIQLEQGQTSAQVTLDGSGSSDSDGQIVAYSWSGTPDPDDVVSPEVTLSPGQHTFTLVVTDDKAADSAPDSVTITVNEAANVPPTANAGEDQTVQLEQGQTSMQVMLVGSASIDPDGTIVEYDWSGTPEPADMESPVVDLPEGVHTFTLVVTDNDNASSSPDDCVITVLAAQAQNQPPIADAGSDQDHKLLPGYETVSVTLNGSASLDPDGEVVGYSWSGTPDPADEVQPSVELAAGEYIFALIVTDNEGASSVVDEVIVNVAAVSPPVISVVPEEVTIPEGGTASISVSASDPDGGPVTLAAFPHILGADFDASPAVNAVGQFSFQPEPGVTGVFQVLFSTRDGDGLSAQQSARIIVTPVNEAPTLTGPAEASGQEGDIITISVTASDPDGDVVEVSASNVPENAIFVEATRTVSFLPADGQAGTYHIDFEATDGLLSSAPHQVEVTVNERTGGGGTDPRELLLYVDPVQSPTFNVQQKITGSVNTSPTGPTPTPLLSALITELSPANGAQGQTLNLTIRGDSDSFPVHFQDGLSEVSLGDGVAIETMTVNSPTEINAQIVIDEDAAVGPRSVSVVTAEEVAISLVAFSIQKGQGTIRGVLKDSQSGAPLAGALVSIVGSNQSVTTAADGSYLFTGVEPGTYQLLVNAPDHEYYFLDVTSTAGSETQVGELELVPLVYDPASPPSATLLSVVGRGATDVIGDVTIEEAKKVIEDTIIAVGGTEGGVLDEYGNQLNPLVDGHGIISLPASIVMHKAEWMSKKVNFPLHKLLFGISYVFEWSGGSPPTLQNWLDLLQAEVNRAWSNPTEGSSKIVIAMFNRGRTVTPEPPQLTPDHQMNALQGYLFAGSFLAYVHHVREANPQLLASAASSPSGWNFSDWIVPKAYAQVEPGALPPNVDVMSAYWNNMMDPWNLPASFWGGSVGGTIAGMAGGEFFPHVFGAGFSTNDIADGPGKVVSGGFGSRTSNYSGVFDVALGFVGDFLINSMVSLAIQETCPATPFVEFAKQEFISIPSDPTNPNSDPLDWQFVRIRFHRSMDDRGAGNQSNVAYVYRLFMYDFKTSNFALLSSGPPREPDGRHGFADGPVIDPSDRNRLEFVVPNAPLGHNLYRIDVIRFVGVPPAGTWSNLAENLPWWTGFATGPGLNLRGRGVFSPIGALFTAMDPLMQIASAIRMLPSRMTENITLYVKATQAQQSSVQGMYVDRRRNRIYVSVPENDMIYLADGATGILAPIVRPGFKAPHQSGLAVDVSGDIFTDNSASDALYGGRIFRFLDLGTLMDPVTKLSLYLHFPQGPFTSPSAIYRPGKQFFGVVNYYSSLLGYAHPVSVNGIALSESRDLLIAEGMSNTIRLLPYGTKEFEGFPERNVSRVWAESPLFSFTPDMDMAPGFGIDKLMLVQHNGIFRVWENNTSGVITRGAEKLLESAGPIFTRPRSASYDARGNLYVADFGDGFNGSIYFLPPWAQIHIPEPRDCTLDKLKIARNIRDIGILRTFDNDSALVFRGNDGIHVTRLGLSGSVKDANGDPVIGALVRVKTNYNGTTAPTRTNNCGNFHVHGLKNHVSTGGGMAEVTVTVPQVGDSSADRTFSAYIDPIGHTIRDFTIDTVVPPPSFDPDVGIDEVLILDPTDLNFTIPQVPIDPDAPREPVQINMVYPVSDMATNPGTQVPIVGTVSDPDIEEVVISINGTELVVPVHAGRFEHTFLAQEGYSTVTIRTNTPRSDPYSAAAQSVVVQGGFSDGTPTQTVFGYVMDRSSQLPLAGAYIENQTSGNKQYTRSDGYFAFPNEPEGAVDLEVK